MVMYDFSKTHTAAQALQTVHTNMIQKFQVENNDVKKAQQMQAYLQYFKKIFQHPEQYTSNDELFQVLGLEEQVIEEMKTRFQQILGVSSKYQIFKSEHSWYVHRKDFDDIVEGELNALLQVVAEKATKNKNIDLGQKIVGSEDAFIDFDELETGLIDGVSNSLQGKISNKKISKILSNIKVDSRSGKTDVKGYNRNLVISADIDKNFEDFINLFTGVNFSVKNYKGNSKYEIHLGESNPFKAMYGSLTDLGYDKKTSVHIYSHSMASYEKAKGTIHRNNDIYHLRFMYELTGAGLFTMINNEKQKIDAVDFLIYNDPTSDKIFVKSTKQMILQQLNDKNMKINNPWKNIYVTKLSFE